LIEDFFKSAKQHLNDNGTIIVTVKNSTFYKGFQVAKQAEKAGLVLKDKQVIELQTKVPGFSHSQTKDLSQSAEFPDGSVQFTFGIGP